VGVPFVGLTGGIGAGKSVALEALAGLGAAVIDADAIVHGLYATEEVRGAVRSRFGDEVFAGEQVDRAALARRAFADDMDRAWLEALLWPRVAERTEAFRVEASSREPPPVAVVVEAPLLFEAGVASRYDTTIAIVADDALRAARVAARDMAELGRREARQLPQAEKARRARFVVANDGTVDELRERLRVVLAEIAS
jgi:dephospho-CoA kinase